MIAMLSAVSAIPSAWPMTVAKATIVLVAAAGLALALHRSSAAFRHLIWLLALASCVVLAVAAPAVPRIDVPVRALSHAGGSAARAIGVDAPRIRVSSPVIVRIPQQIKIHGRPVDIVVPSVAAVPASPIAFRDALPFFLIAAWVVGFVVVIGRARLGHSRVASIVDDARRLTSAEWRVAIRNASIDVGIGRDVEVFESDEISSPMTSGFLNPVIVVPMEARDWDAERRHIVLVHELAHVTRLDYLAQLVATAACAIFWFHPFVWLAAARLRVEAEHAADDHVLNAGTGGVTYATHLLDLARRHAGGLSPAAAVGMVRSARLEGRFRAMLDATRSRAAVSPRLQATAASLTLCAMIPVAGLRPVASQRSAPRFVTMAPTVARDFAATTVRRAMEARRVDRAVAVAAVIAARADSIVEKTIDASSGDRLTLDLRSGGAIVIHGWDEPRIRVVGRLGGRDWRDTRVSLERVDGGVRLRSDFESARENTSTSHQFELWVPRHTSVQLSSAGGSLAINDVSGDFYGHTGGGGITIEGATGSASLTTGGGEISIANSRLSGTVSTGGGELTVTNVTGGLRGSSGSGGVIVSTKDGASTVRGGGFGYGMSTGVGGGVASTIISGGGARTGVISGATTMGNFDGIRRGKARGIGFGPDGAIAISKDGGEIVVDRAPDGAVLQTGGGRIVVGSSERGVRATTGGGDIELEDLAGDATASTGAGDVRIRIVNSVRDDHSVDVQSGSGRVVIEVPASLDARIELETAYTNNFNRRTHITSDFSLEQSETDQWDSSEGTPRRYVRATGVVGSGRGLIRVHTVNGDVVLRRINR